MLVQLIILLLSYKVLWLVEKFVLNHLTDTPIEKICNYYFFYYAYFKNLYLRSSHSGLCIPYPPKIRDLE